jgi:molecular chaperone Hsp33
MTATPSSTDSLRRGPNADDTLSVVTVCCTQAVADACEGAGLRGIDAIALGRAFAGAFLLMANAKRDEERLRIQIAGEGQLGQIIVDIHGDGRGRAAVQAALPAEHPLHILVHEEPRPVIAPAVGLPGTMTITRDLGVARRYQGHVDLVSAEIDEDLQAYLHESEQVRSALRVDVRLDESGRVTAAGGVMIQALPQTEDTLIDEARERLCEGAVYRSLEDGASHEALAALALGVEASQLDLGPQYERALRFECNCGPERARRVLSSLGAEDLDNLADEQAITEIRCNFCGKVTEVEADTVRDIAAALRRRTN